MLEYRSNIQSCIVEGRSVISVQFCREELGRSGGGDGGGVLARTSSKYCKVASFGVFVSGRNPKIKGA